jgi:hypothetical protein
MNTINNQIILHSVNVFLCGIIILNQVIIIHKNVQSHKALHNLEIFHGAAKASFDNAVVQLDEIQKRLNEISTSSVRYQLKGE